MINLFLLDFNSSDKCFPSKMTVFRIFVVILLLYSIKYIIQIRFRGLICHIVCFSSLIILEVIAKTVNKKYLPVFFLQICKNVKLIIFTFGAIFPKQIGLQKPTIRQINRLNLTNLVYLMIYITLGWICSQTPVFKFHYL